MGQASLSSLHVYFEKNHVYCTTISSFFLGGASVSRCFLHCFIRSCFTLLDSLGVSYSFSRIARAHLGVVVYPEIATAIGRTVSSEIEVKNSNRESVMIATCSLAMIITTPSSFITFVDDRSSAFP